MAKCCQPFHCLIALDGVIPRIQGSRGTAAIVEAESLLTSHAVVEVLLLVWPGESYSSAAVALLSFRPTSDCAIRAPTCVQIAAQRVGIGQYSRDKYPER